MSNATVEVETVFLEMHARPTRPAAQPPRTGIRVVTAEQPTVPFYRFLYREVGEPWGWHERAQLDDDSLAAAIRHPDVEIDVLWIDGVPAGYVELDARHHRETQILYFGLIPSFIGRGLGHFFLDWSIDRAFTRHIDRLWVHTCSLDHPRALRTYERAGFREYHRERGVIQAPYF